MPIGVPRIIYCWGEELPPQWTDIYNFIFRRRMVFLMQYLDDELCNQICGLLINIHMEDRSKELEKKEIEKSGIFKSASSTPPLGGKSGQESKLNSSLAQIRGAEGASKKRSFSGGKKKEKSMEDLLSSYGNSAYEEDLAIDENYTLEQYSLQKITLEWLNWNAQFFDYSDEPYLFYLAEILSKNFSYSKDDTQLFYQTALSLLPKGGGGGGVAGGKLKSSPLHFKKKEGLDVYSPFRSIVNVANLIAKDKNFSIKNFLPPSLLNEPDSLNKGTQWSSNLLSPNLQENASSSQKKMGGLAKLMGVLALPKSPPRGTEGGGSVPKGNNFINTAPQNQLVVPSKALGQRNLKKEYAMDNMYQSTNAGRPFTSKQTRNKKALNYLDFDSSNSNQSYLFAETQNRNEYSRKQTKKALQEEETKKVFVIINSFGGSVGNGITVHDALQFIKAGSLTLGLGVAASAASLVLAGGTISERYVTEGCHVMIHQPSSSINGQASDIWIDSQEIMKIRLDVAEIYSLSAHRPRHKILRDLDRDFYLTATETIHYGLADEIATNEVMHDIIEMTSKVWSYHDSKQQSLLETRDRASSGMETQLQN